MTGLFVRHNKRRHIEVAFVQCMHPIHHDLSATYELRKALIEKRTETLCKDFRGLTSEDFGLLEALDIFIDVYTLDRVGSELHEIFREVLATNVGAAVNPTVMLSVYINDKAGFDNRISHK